MVGQLLQAAHRLHIESLLANAGPNNPLSEGETPRPLGDSAGKPDQQASRQ